MKRYRRTVVTSSTFAPPAVAAVLPAALMRSARDTSLGYEAEGAIGAFGQP